MLTRKIGKVLRGKATPFHVIAASLLGEVRRGNGAPAPPGIQGVAAALMLGFPMVLAPIVAMVLSLGYDMTQPLFAGIVTSLGGKRAGQAMGLNVFMLFIGFGLGSLIFGELLRYSFAAALGVFAVVEMTLALLSLALFRSEVPSARPTISIQG